MSLSITQIETAATSLFNAEASGTQIGLISQQHPSMTLDDAYAIQKSLMEKSLANGKKIIGWKIGLTSKAMRSVLKIDTPDSGVLLNDMLFENGCRIPATRFIEPRIEAEIAFVMKSPLAGESVTRNDVIAATDYVVAAIEILDTRIIRRDNNTGEIRKITDTISDNAANAGIVLGNEKHAIDSVDLRWVGAVVSKNNEVEETGLGAGVLNDPVTGIVWLAQRMAEYGQRIEAGQVILSGSFIRPVECPSGSFIEADFNQFGRVEMHFD